MLVGAEAQRKVSPRGSCRATAGMLIRLSTRGKAGSGTTYSPGVLLPATWPAGWMRPDRMPPLVGAAESAAVLSLAADLSDGLPAVAALSEGLPGALSPAFSAVLPAAAFLAES